MELPGLQSAHRPLPGTAFGLVQAIVHAAVRAVRRRALLDHLIGAQQNRWGYRKTERRGGLAVHGHLKFCRKLHRKIARLLAAQDAIDISGGATKEVYQVGSVGKQTAFSGKVR